MVLLLTAALSSAPMMTITAAIEQPTPTPAWWNNWRRLSTFSSPFVQESESAAFGKLASKGTILIASGGRLRVEYDKGAILLCDGRQLVQYDPSTRTAQRHGLDGISDDWPLLRVLTDPTTLDQVFKVTVQSSGEIVLTPKNPGPPEIVLTGKGEFLHSAAWTDGTGAKQVLTLTAPRIPPSPGKERFSFRLPAGAKWINNPGPD
jgi:outer membrane lipoprotein-sorting protein